MWHAAQVLHKQGTLDAAISLVDKRMVSKLTSESGRSLFLVEGSLPVPYGARPAAKALPTASCG